MGIWERIKRLFSSNVSAILDKAENPKAALELITRDMEAELRNTKTYVADAIVNLKKLEKDHETQLALARDYEQKARIILSDGDESNDYLAKEALLRKKDAEALAAQYKVAADKQRESVEALRRNIGKMDRKVGDAKRQKDILLAQKQIAETQQKIVAATSATAGSGAFEEYKRIGQKIEEQTQRAMIEAELAQGPASLDDQLEEITFGSEVENELEALKSQIALEAKAAPKELPPSPSPSKSR
jgi:phage shock protein A